MKHYFYTYGLGDEQPFEGGWTEIVAPDRRTADKIFVAVHPCVSDGILNCAWTYDEEAFFKTKMLKNGNFGKYCQELIEIIRTDDE